MCLGSHYLMFYLLTSSSTKPLPASIQNDQLVSYLTHFEIKHNHLIQMSSMIYFVIRLSHILQTAREMLLISRTTVRKLYAGPWFNIKMPSYQYRKSHCGDKTVVRSSYLHHGISYTGKMASLYWISPQKSQLKWHGPQKRIPLVGDHLAFKATQRGGRFREVPTRVIHVSTRSLSFRFLVLSFNELIIYPRNRSTHWDRDKMATILQMIFPRAFSWMKLYFDLNFPKVVS